MPLTVDRNKAKGLEADVLSALFASAALCATFVEKRNQPVVTAGDERA